MSNPAPALPRIAVRKPIGLTQDQADKLRRLALHYGRTEAGTIRYLIEQACEPEPPTP